MQGFDAIHPEPLQKRILPSGAKLRKIKALGDDHGRRSTRRTRLKVSTASFGRRSRLGARFPPRTRPR
ncbi:hypothetical protein CNY89_29150, partial [Amaricoccus sp. HAR-UPW-R2A-40]